MFADLETRIPCQSHVLRPGRNRTYDRQIRRLLLYPLSYGGWKRAVRPPAGSGITVAPERGWQRRRTR